ncbi:hypothetical protein [Dactylosporangium salmoneum]
MLAGGAVAWMNWLIGIGAQLRPGVGGPEP